MAAKEAASPPAADGLLAAYLRFLRSPHLSPPDNTSASQALGQTLRLYSLHLLILLVLGGIISQVVLQQDSLLPAVFSELSPWLLLGLAVIAAPLVEEGIFRLPLWGTPFTLGVSVSLLVWVGVNAALGFNRLAAAGLGTVLVSLNLYLWLKHRRATVWPGLYSRYPRFIFYGSAVLFGIVHITNYSFEVWALLPLLVMPQIVIGLLLGFVRLHHGFTWAVLLHGFHNGCVLLPVFLLRLFGSSRFQVGELSSSDVSALPVSDQLLLGAVGLYFLGGICLCVRVSWKLLRESGRPV